MTSDFTLELYSGAGWHRLSEWLRGEAPAVVGAAEPLAPGPLEPGLFALRLRPDPGVQPWSSGVQLHVPATGRPVLVAQRPLDSSRFAEAGAAVLQLLGPGGVAAQLPLRLHDRAHPAEANPLGWSDLAGCMLSALPPGSSLAVEPLRAFVPPAGGRRIVVEPLEAAVLVARWDPPAKASSLHFSGRPYLELTGDSRQDAEALLEGLRDVYNEGRPLAEASLLWLGDEGCRFLLPDAPKGESLARAQAAAQATPEGALFLDVRWSSVSLVWRSHGPLCCEVHFPPVLSVQTLPAVPDGLDRLRVMRLLQEAPGPDDDAASPGAGEWRDLARWVVAAAPRGFVFGGLALLPGVRARLALAGLVEHSERPVDLSLGLQLLEVQRP